MADRISQTRMSKVIQESPYLRRRAQPEPGVARGPANIRRRTVGPGIVYFCGAEEETQYSGIDADVVILDEYDLMEEEVLSLAQARLRSSGSPRLRVTSTPTISDFGVSYLFEMSDQGYYELSCQQCGAWQEPQFPDGVDWDTLQVVCLHCRAPLDPWQEGRWVFRRPADSAVRGYQLNRLALPRPPLREMRMALDGTIPTSKETFYRQDLGQPFTSPESRLTPEILDSCIEPWRPELMLKMYVMGIDVGSKLHVVIRGRYKNKWYLFEAFTADSFEELEQCFSCYRIQCCVVDAYPETREARRFQQGHLGTVWLAQYTQQGLEPDWSHGEWVVRAPRTLILDEMLHRFREHTYILPPDIRTVEDGQYFRQLQAPVRTTELDNWGHPVATYRHREADDFAHAEVYATLATIRARLSEVEVLYIAVGPEGLQAIKPEHSDYAPR
jgi:Phage terminase large subunit (GpA)